MVTKLRNEITNFHQRPDESLFEAWERYKLSIDRCPNHNMLPVTQIDTFYNGLTLRHRDTINAAAGGTFMKRRPEECYDLIENMTAHHNDWDTTIPRVNSVTPSCETCGGPHSYHECQAAGGHIQNVYAAGTYNQGGNTYQPQGNRNLLSYRSDNYLGPPGFNVNQNQNRNNQNQNYQNRNQGNNQGNNQGRNQFFQGASQVQNPRIWLDKEPPRSILTWDDLVSKFINHLFPPSKATNLRNEISNFQQKFKETFCEAWDRFKDLLRACPHYGFTELHQLDTFYYGLNPSDQDSLNFAPVAIFWKEIASAVASAVTSAMTAIFKQHQVTPAPASVKAVKESYVTCGDECLALADLDASINLMPLSIWKKLSLPELTPTQMILELADRSTTRPAGIAEDVFVKVGKFHFPTDFVVVDYVVDPRVPLILGRPFLRTGRALIDVYGEELTLRHDDEAVTFKVGQTLRYFYNDAESINRIDVIDVACGEYAQEVLGFSEISTSGNPTSEPIISTSSPTLTPFGDSDILLGETDAFLAIEDDSISPEIDDSYYDSKGDIRLLEEFLNDDPSSPLPLQELRFVEPKTKKSSIDDPSELELKDLPSHLEYAFLEGTDKLPIIIAKDLKEHEKVRLLKVLKSHKRAIAWKISDIKGIDPQFCTHKILMKDDSKLAIQHQRPVNPKIHEVIKKEVIKLLDAGLIYPISDSPWVSPVHCVPKKGGITVIENDANELIHTQLVMGWRVCIDYRKLNDATRKDHFPLPFMDQMLERLVGNEYYCFLDGF
ncbi:reverse transcriptase domain-containing protein [Tanacetum coccineum]|uniref:Reverse transcriptase domain-containing protein n=1 Tax=Tanacetum coccineum TaxID=301880 RepID=A0ABQ5GBF8_9ASTR